MRGHLFAILLSCALAAPALAQQPSDLDALTKAESEARSEEARLKAEREQVGQDIAELKRQLQRDTEETRAYEREAQRLTDRLSELEDRIGTLADDLSANREQVQILFASLQRLQLAPSVATYGTPSDAVKTAQTATMIDLLTRELQRRSASIVSVTAELETSRALASERRVELDRTAAEITQRQERTAALVAQKETLRKTIEDDEIRARAEVARLAAESDTLRELLENLAAAGRSVTPRLKPGQALLSAPVSLPAGTLPFAQAQGALIRPVSGRLSKAFGRGERGQTYSAPTGGQVLAPYAGRVEFAGPFKTYGQMVILNMDDGYFLLLTGLDALFVGVGETVTRGEPVGRMPDPGSRTALYLELRQNGRTIDPAPWMGG